MSMYSYAQDLNLNPHEPPNHFLLSQKSPTRRIPFHQATRPTIRMKQRTNEERRNFKLKKKRMKTIEKFSLTENERELE